MATTRPYLTFLVLVTVCLALIYIPSLPGDFVWDDAYLVARNRSLHSLHGLARLVTHDLWTSADGAPSQLYHPVPMATLWAQVQLTGLAIVPLRLANLAMHLGCCLSLLALLRRLRLGPRVAFCTAFVFALHPLATEPVMWLTGRHDSLGALFSLFALLVSPRPDTFSRESLKYSILTGIFTALAFASKEPFVITPALVTGLCLIEALPVSPLPSLRRCAVLVAPSYISIGLVFVLRHALSITSSSTRLGATPWEHLKTFSTLVAHYTSLIVSVTQGPTIATYHPLGALSTLAVALVSVSLYALIFHWVFRTEPRRSPSALGALFGLFWYFISLSPHLVSLPVIGLWGNRYGYFPSMGFMIALAAVITHAMSLDRAWLRRALALVFSVTVVTALTETRASVRIWHDDLSLYGDSVSRNPRDGRAVYHLGYAVLHRQGCSRAVGIFSRATALDPTYARAQRNYAGCLLQLHRPAEAIAPAERAVALEPWVAAHHYNLGAALALSGDTLRARRELQTALTLDPHHRAARELLRALR